MIKSAPLRQSDSHTAQPGCERFPSWCAADAGRERPVSTSPASGLLSLLSVLLKKLNSPHFWASVEPAREINVQRVAWRRARRSIPASAPANRRAPVWCSGPEHQHCIILMTSPRPMQGKCYLYFPPQDFVESEQLFSRQEMSCFTQERQDMC